MANSAAAENTIDALRRMKVRAQEIGGPRWFFEQLGQEIQEWQEELCEAVLDVRRKAAGHPTAFNHEGKPRITIRSCHGTGKTHSLAFVLHLWNFVTYGLVACTAPKQDQLKTRLWPRYRAVLRSSPPWYKSMIKVDTLRIKVLGDEDWGAIAETASEPENLAGYHDKPQLFLVDEASGQRLDPMYPVIEGALTTEGSVIVEIGNPTRSSGEFWAHHNKRGVAELYYRMHIKPEDAKEYISQDWLKNMAKKYGIDSPIYKIRCLGEFVEQEANQLIPYGWLTEAREREFEEDGSIPRLVVSVDVAAGGDDFTVTEASNFYETKTLKMRQEKHSFPAKTASLETARAAAEMFDRFDGKKDGNDLIVIDMMGVGNGAYNYLIEWGYPVVGYAGGSTGGVDTKRWRNKRVKVYWTFHDDLKNDKLHYSERFVDNEDDWDEYFDQVCMIRRRDGGERIEDLEPKEMLIKRTRKSPDRADTSAMAYITELPDIADSDEEDVEVMGSTMMESYDGGIS